MRDESSTTLPCVAARWVANAVPAPISGVPVGQDGRRRRRSGLVNAPFTIEFHGVFMRQFVRPLLGAMSLAFVSPVGMVATSANAFAQDQPSQAPDVKQIALTPARIDAFVSGGKEIEAILSTLPEDAADKPDPGTEAKLDAAAKKYGFASFDDYNEVSGNIELVMDGIDPATQKYVGAEAVINAQIAEVSADKSMAPKERKDALAELNEAKKSVVKVKFPANIDLVVANYARLAPAEPQKP